MKVRIGILDLGEPSKNCNPRDNHTAEIEIGAECSKEFTYNEAEAIFRAVKKFTALRDHFVEIPTTVDLDLDFDMQAEVGRKCLLPAIDIVQTASAATVCRCAVTGMSQMVRKY